MPAAVLARASTVTRRLLAGELARGSVVYLGFAFGNAGLAFLASVFAGNALGPAGVGVLALGMFVLDLAGMLDNLGSAGFMRDYAAGEAPAKLATIFRLKVLLGLGTAALMVVLAPLLGPILDIPTELLLVLAIVPVTSVLGTLATMVHEARRRPWLRCASGTVEAGVKAALFAGFWIVLGVRGDVLAYAWAVVGASAVGGAVGAVVLPRLRASAWERPRAHDYLKFGLAAQAAQFLQKLLFWIDVLLIGVLLDSHYQQGLYRTAFSVMAFVPLFAGSVAVFLFPAISEASQLGHAARVRELLRRSFETVLVIAVPMIAVAIVLARPALRLFGPEFVEAEWILHALALIAVLPSLLVPFQALFPALGKPGVLLRISAAMLLTNATLDVVLIPQMGVTGALVAATCTFTMGLALSVLSARALGVLGRPAQ